MGKLTMAKHSFDFEAIKHQLQVDLEKHSFFTPLRPKHTKIDVKNFTEAFVRFKLSPSFQTYCNFLNMYFKSSERAITPDSLSTYPFLVLDEAKETNMLFESALVFSSWSTSTSMFPFVKSILSSTVPLKSTSSLFNFLDATVFSVTNLNEQILLLEWLTPKLKALAFPYQLPYLESTSVLSKIRYCDSFLTVLSEANQSLSSPFESISLVVQEIPKSGEVKGDLTINLSSKDSNLTKNEATETLGQNHTYLLGFLVACEQVIKVDVANTPPIPLELFLQFSKETGAFVGSGKTKANLDKEIWRLNQIVSDMVAPLSPKIKGIPLVRSSKHTKRVEDDWVSLNTTQPSTVENPHLVFNKKKKTRHKKPREPKS